jgi:Spy/CpxP family protein refolding chaperone
MSRFYTIALGLALCAGTAVTTNAQTASSAKKSDTTAIMRHHNRSQMRSGRTERGDRALFKGIDLSSAQKAKVDSIRSKYRSESKSLREQMGPEMKNARAARQSGDSAKIKEAREGMSASREKMMTLRKQEMGEIRGVLTPAQQSTFDKNVNQQQSRMHDARGARRGGRSGSTTH